MDDNDQTKANSAKFDFNAFPPDTLFFDRRTVLDRRDQAPQGPAPEAAEVVPPSPARERRARKERRRRIDPTTFEKQYTDDEVEFMTAMQHFKVQSGKPFPSHAEVLAVARSLGYDKVELQDLTPEIPVAILAH